LTKARTKGHRLKVPAAAEAEVIPDTATSVSPARPLDTSAAGALFGQAMQAFDTGSYAVADARFERFAREFGNDPRSEDAAFLRIVCAIRRGDRTAVAQLSHAYLGTYPHGLRRHDVERLLR
jgi:TolA-binding protein